MVLNVLNKLPNRDLCTEHLHQKALEHSTLLKYRFISGEPVTVPDPESWLSLTDPTGRIKLTWETDVSETVSPRAHSCTSLSKLHVHLANNHHDTVRHTPFGTEAHVNMISSTIMILTHAALRFTCTPPLIFVNETGTYRQT